jgi:arabinose-5-phosphate isomerase
MNAGELIELGRRVVRLEAQAMAEVEGRLGDEFARAVRLIADSKGRVIVAGVGKSGLIGRKIAATLTSTGTPAAFLHPVDSVHGDLGIVGADDVAILLSKSGESDELLGLLAHLKGFGVKTIAITGVPTSALGGNCDVCLNAAVREEACPHDLAPTTSTTAALVLGDALAVALLQEKGFQREDFARLHPGGALGRQLVIRVEEIMLTTDLPLLTRNATMRDAIVMIAKRRGIAVIVEANRVAGVVTAGDLSRLIERDPEVMSVRVDQVMTPSPKIATVGELASAVAYRMEKHGIMAMPVVDDDERVRGVVHLHDLMRARVV